LGRGETVWLRRADLGRLEDDKCQMQLGYFYGGYLPLLAVSPAPQTPQPSLPPSLRKRCIQCGGDGDLTLNEKSCSRRRSASRGCEPVHACSLREGWETFALISHLQMYRASLLALCGGFFPIAVSRSPPR
jgi:hypothetical protein